MEVWVGLTVMAALMQSVRTAGQKKLAHGLTATGAAVVRYLYGLPFALLYLFWLVYWQPDASGSLPDSNERFLLFAFLASLTQLIATALMVWLFRFRNFAIGSMYVKTEALLAALLGAVLFSESLSAMAWLSIVLGAIGIMLISSRKSSAPEHGADQSHLMQWLFNPAAGTGLLAGGLFAMTSLCLRQASLSLDTGFQLSAAYTLAVMVIMQSLIGILYLSFRSASDWGAMSRQHPACVFVGLTSVMGSVGWFTAMTLQPVAYVKAVGQIEFIFTLMIAVLFFREKLTAREILGMLVIVAGVLLLLLAS